MRRLIRFLVLAAAVYAAVLALLYTQQRALLYPGSGRAATAAEAGLTDFVDLTLETLDGERVKAWWKPPEPGKAVVLYFHGNGGSLWQRRGRARALAADGRGVLLASYRGYSGSTGSPTEEGLALDARAAYTFLAGRYEPARIVLYGESLGSGVAVRLASERPVGGVILESPFASAAAVAERRYPFVPVAWLMHDQFRSIDRIGAVKAPLLVLHGALDDLTPIAMGEELFRAANEPKRFVRIEGAGHVNVFDRGGLEPVRAFLAETEARLAS